MLNTTLKHLLSTTLVLGAVLTLAACGGSDSETDYAESYLQFYNGSSTSSYTIMTEVDASDLGGASYGDASSLLTLDDGDIDLEFYRYDADDQVVDVGELSTNLRQGYKTLLVLSGDYEDATFNEYSFERKELSDHFRLFATSVVTDKQSYDLHVSEAGAPFSAAHLLGTINYEGFEEMTYWDPDTESDYFDEGEYVIYLTLPGETTPVFESQTISFTYETEYVLALRTTTGAIKDNIEVDLIINSTTVVNYADEEASSQYRIYNSLDKDDIAQISLDGNDGTDTSLELASNTLGEFTKIDFGDYRLSVNFKDNAELFFNNRLVTLNQGQSKAIVLYTDANDQLASISFVESNLPQVYDHQVQAVNLVPDFQNLDLYFVRKDETIETAEYYVTSVDFAESRSLTLPSDYYELIAVYDNNDDTQVLLDRTELLGINEEFNYIISIEKTDSSPTGYKIALIH